MFLISVSGSCLLCLFCLLLVSRCCFVVVFCLLSCFVLNHNIWYVFALHIVFLLLCFCCFGIFVNFGYLSKNIPQKTGYCKKKKKANNETCRNKKTDIFTRVVSTGVLTNSVFFLFGVSLKFACFAENTIKIWVSAKNPTKKNCCVKNGPRLCQKQVQLCCETKLDRGLFCFILFFLKHPLLSAGRTRFSKQKNKIYRCCQASVWCAFLSFQS